jgi:hypothetical protein
MISRIKFFIKKLRLKKDELEALEIKSGLYDAAMNQISFETIPEDIYAKDGNGNKVIRFTKSIEYILHIKLKKLLNCLGIEFDDCVKLDIDQN